tara:strand:- start:1382 stop:1843 length:462 start_codon:yes stop_codon:yes gene_type:complete
VAVTFFQTYKEIQDKLSSVIRSEFRGYSVYFDDDYTNRKPSYFNIKRTRDALVENLVPKGQFRDYGFNVRYYLKKPGYSKDLVLHALFRVGDRINQLIFNNKNILFNSDSKNYYFIDAHFENYDIDPTRADSENVNDLHLLSFDFGVNVFEVV